MPRHAHLPTTSLRSASGPLCYFFAPPQVDESVLQMRRKLAALDAGARRASRDEAQRRTDALERSRRMDRVCMVIDFDMFYAAVEQLGSTGLGWSCATASACARDSAALCARAAPR